MQNACISQLLSKAAMQENIVTILQSHAFVHLDNSTRNMFFMFFVCPPSIVALAPQGAPWLPTPPWSRGRSAGGEGRGLLPWGSFAVHDIMSFCLSGQAQASEHCTLAHKLLLHSWLPGRMTWMFEIWLLQLWAMGNSSYKVLDLKCKKQLPVKFQHRDRAHRNNIL